MVKGVWSKGINFIFTIHAYLAVCVINDIVTASYMISE